MKKRKKFLKKYAKFDKWLNSKGLSQQQSNTVFDYHYSFYDKKVDSMHSVECWRNPILKISIRFLRDRNKHLFYIIDQDVLLSLKEFKKTIKIILNLEIDKQLKQLNEL